MRVYSNIWFQQSYLRSRGHFYYTEQAFLFSKVSFYRNIDILFYLDQSSIHVTGTPVDPLRVCVTCRPKQPRNLHLYPTLLSIPAVFISARNQVWVYSYSNNNKHCLRLTTEQSLADITTEDGYFCTAESPHVTLTLSLHKRKLLNKDLHNVNITSFPMFWSCKMSYY